MRFWNAAIRLSRFGDSASSRWSGRDIDAMEDANAGARGGVPIDVLVAARAAAGAYEDGGSGVDFEDEKVKNPAGSDGPPEFEFEDDEGGADADDGASSSSEWSSSSSSDAALDDGADDDEDSDSVESLDAADLPEWLKRVKDGPPKSADEFDDAAHVQPPRTRNEIVKEGPKSVPEVGDGEEIRLIGKVMSRVGDVVVVQSAPGAKQKRSAGGGHDGGGGGDDDEDEPLDEDSVLCLRDRRGLGAIEEVFGPVSSPLYSLRLPSKADCASTPDVRVDDEVFVVVGRSRRIPTKGLYKKGYDASGKDDEEVGEDEEFSDDEVEAAVKAAKKQGNKKRPAGGGARANRAPAPSPMGGGGMFGMRGLPRPPPPPHAAMGAMGLGGGAQMYAPPGGQPMMYVPVQMNAQGQPVIMMPPYGGQPPPPPPPPPPK